MNPYFTNLSELAANLGDDHPEVVRAAVELRSEEVPSELALKWAPQENGWVVEDSTGFRAAIGAPAASEVVSKVSGVRVSGIGNADSLNGFYEENGTANGKPKYTKDGFTLEAGLSGYGGGWVLHGPHPSVPGDLLRILGDLTDHPWEVNSADWSLDENTGATDPNLSNILVEKASLVDGNLTVGTVNTNKISMRHSSDSLEITPLHISSTFNGTLLEFEEGRFQAGGSNVIAWGGNGSELSVEGRVVKNLGAPVDDNDAVRKVDLDTKPIVTLLEAGSSSDQDGTLGAARNQIVTYNSYNFSQNRNLTLPRSNEGAQRGDKIRLTHKRQSHQGGAWDLVVRQQEIVVPFGTPQYGPGFTNLIALKNEETVELIADQAGASSPLYWSIFNPTPHKSTHAIGGADALTPADIGAASAANFGGANGTTAGTAGLVPLPAATDNTKFLRGNGTWASVTEYTNPLVLNATWSAENGLTFSQVGRTDFIGRYVRLVVSGEANTNPTIILPKSGESNSSYIGVNTTQEGDILEVVTSDFGMENRTWTLQAYQKTNSSPLTYGTLLIPVESWTYNTQTGLNSGAETRTYQLRNGDWVKVDANFHTHNTFLAPRFANSLGRNGFVPAPAFGDETKFLRGDGTWATAAAPMVMLQIAGEAEGGVWPASETLPNANTPPSVEFVFPWNKIQINQDSSLFTPDSLASNIRRNILVNAPSGGAYFEIQARYTSYDLYDSNTFMRIRARTSSSPITDTNGGNLLTVVAQGRTGTTLNGEASITGRAVVNLAGPTYLALTVRHEVATGYPVNTNAGVSGGSQGGLQPYIIIRKL